MEKNFWINKWQINQIGFHQAEYNSLLVKHWDEFSLNHQRESVLVPLCGKTKDMLYLLSKGHKVVGVELSEIAVQDFFRENGILCQVEEIPQGKIYYAEGIKIYCCDMFEIINELVAEGISLVYDRASIVALPEELRQKYIEILNTNLKGVHIFMVTLGFDNNEIGPPFSIKHEQVLTYFKKEYLVKEIEVQVISTEEIRTHKDKVTEMANHLNFVLPKA